MKPLLCLAATTILAFGSELRFALHAEPKTLDPFLMADESAEALCYLTEGVLIRINRGSGQPEPALAESWKIEKNGAVIVFHLRTHVQFPDGSAFTSDDVIQTFHRMLDPDLHSPIADSFKTEKGSVRVTADGPLTAVVEFPAPAAGIERRFDQVAIVSAKAVRRPAPGLGPFMITERKPGVSVLLKRNPGYWKRDGSGQRLPRIDSIRLDIEQNRDLEALRFRRGEIQLIDKLTPDLYERMAAETRGNTPASGPGTAIDAGPTLDSEFLWFNQAKRAPISGPAKEWFQSTVFRRAVGQAINRADLCRVVYRGHASPAAGPVSPANLLWFKQGLIPQPFDPYAAAKSLQSAGFRVDGPVLRDRSGNAVEFSIITNAGSKTRESMAVMIQQDLSKLGIRVNIVSLDFPSLVERITRTLNYESCLLGLVNVDPDPGELMSLLLSSASNHAWNPAQKSPETPWEAEIDQLMLAQAATATYRERKKDFDRVQDILSEQSPILYLLYPNALSAISRQLSGVQPSVFYPHTFWDAERLTLRSPK